MILNNDVEFCGYPLIQYCKEIGNVLTGVKGRIVFKLMLKGKYYGLGMFVVWPTGLAYDR